MLNPYEPPKAPLETLQTRPGFGWRVVPSSFMVLLGAYFVLAPLITIVVEVVRSRGIPRGLGFAETLGMLLISTVGVMWIVSGAMFWKRRWWIAVVLLLVGYGVGVFAGMLIWGSWFP